MEYKPQVQRTKGSRPAVLIHASVNYVGNNQIIAFGGFDQFTDEGKAADGCTDQDEKLTA